MSTRQLNRICHLAAGAAAIDKRVSPHTLRHYLPFLTMSGNVKTFTDMLGSCSLCHAETDPCTRHSFPI